MRGHIYLHHMAFYEKGKKLSLQLFLEYKQGWKFTKPTIHVVRKKPFSCNLIWKQTLIFLQIIKIKWNRNENIMYSVNILWLTQRILTSDFHFSWTITSLHQT